MHDGIDQLSTNLVMRFIVVVMASHGILFVLSRPPDSCKNSPANPFYTMAGRVVLSDIGLWSRNKLHSMRRCIRSRRLGRPSDGRVFARKSANIPISAIIRKYLIESTHEGSEQHVHTAYLIAAARPSSKPSFR